MIPIVIDALGMISKYAKNIALENCSLEKERSIAKEHTP